MVLYKERLLPNFWLFLATLLLIPAITLIFMALSLMWVGVGIGVAVVVLIIVSMIVKAPNIIITDSMFHIGDAAIEREFLEDAEAFYDQEAFKERGQRLKLESFYIFQVGIDPVVKIQNIDEADPVPYWLISTRHPQRIANIINGTEKA